MSTFSEDVRRLETRIRISIEDSVKMLGKESICLLSEEEDTDFLDNTNILPEMYFNTDMQDNEEYFITHISSKLSLTGRLQDDWEDTQQFSIVELPLEEQAILADLLMQKVIKES